MTCPPKLSTKPNEPFWTPSAAPLVASIVRQAVMKPHEHETKYTKDDFTLIANLAYDPSAIAVRADSPIKSIDDLIKSLKENPNSVVAGTSGIGSEDQLLLTRFGTLTGTEVTIAPPKSSGETLIALKGGHVACQLSTAPFLLRRRVQFAFSRLLPISAGNIFLMYRPLPSLVFH